LAETSDIPQLLHRLAILSDEDICHIVGSFQDFSIHSKQYQTLTYVTNNGPLSQIVESLLTAAIRCDDLNKSTNSIAFEKMLSCIELNAL
jgi:hypothetical protein